MTHIGRLTRLQLFLYARKNKQLLMFFLIGGVNTLFGYAVFSLLIYCGLHYICASFLSTCIGVVFNFNTTGKIVFNYHKKDLFFPFVAVYTISYFINIAIIKAGTYLFANIYMIGGIAILITACITYLLNKHFVFQKIQPEAH